MKNEKKDGVLPLFKNKKTALLLVVGVLAGILLIFTGKSAENNASESKSDADRENIAKTEEYITILEGRVKSILEGMDGISNVSVIITPESSYESVYAKDCRYDGGSLTEKKYVVVKNDGNEEVVSVTLLFPKVRGVAVVCNGGSNPINQEKIIKLVSSLLDIEQNKVYVCS